MRPWAKQSLGVSSVLGSDIGAVPETWGGHCFSTHLHPKPQIMNGSIMEYGVEEDTD